MSDDEPTTGMDPLRELGKQLPWDRPDAARREGVRSALLVAANETAPKKPARGFLIGAGFVAGALAAAAVALVLVRAPDESAPVRTVAGVTPSQSSPSSQPSHPSHSPSPQSPSSPSPSQSSGTPNDIVEQRVPAGRTRVERARATTRDAVVDGTGVYDVVVTGDRLASVTVNSGSAKIVVAGHAPVFLAAGETWSAPVDTVEHELTEQPRAGDDTRTVLEQPREHGVVEQPGGSEHTARVVEQPRASDRARIAEQPRGSDHTRVVQQPRGSEHTARVVEQPRGSDHARVVQQPRGSEHTARVGEQPRVATQYPRVSDPASRSVEQPRVAEQPSRSVEAPPVAEPTSRTGTEPPHAPAIVQEPARLPAPASPTEQHFRAGTALLREQRYAAAADELARAAAGNGPLAADARYYQAIALTKAGRARDAEAVLVSFLARSDAGLRRGRAQIMLGRLLVTRGDIAGARAQFTAAQRDSDTSIAAAARAELTALR